MGRDADIQRHFSVPASYFDKKPAKRDNARTELNMPRTSKTSLRKLEQDFLASSPYVLDMTTSSIRKRNNANFRKPVSKVQFWAPFYAALDKELPGDYEVPIRALEDAHNIHPDDDDGVYFAEQCLARAILPFCAELAQRKLGVSSQDTELLRELGGTIYGSIDSILRQLRQSLHVVQYAPDGRFATLMLRATHAGTRSSQAFTLDALGTLAGMLAQMRGVDTARLWSVIDEVLGRNY